MVCLFEVYKNILMQALFHSLYGFQNISLPTSKGDVTKTRKGLKSGLANGLSQFL